jgi:hypothetical protein
MNDAPDSSDAPPPRRRRRWLRVVPWVGIALILLAATGAAILSSQAALEWVVSRARGASEGRLTIEGATGSLLSTVRVARIAWAGDDVDVEAQDMALTWSATDLLSRRFNVTGLGAHRLAFTIKTTSDSAITLPPDLALPLEVNVRNVGVERLEWRIGARTGTVTGRGVYLLSFLPESDVNLIVEYDAGTGKKSFAACLPDNAYGNVVEATFKQAVGRKGGRIVAFEKYGADRAAPARTVAQSLGQADALFLADDGESVVTTADALTAAGANLKNIQLLGTGLWDNPRVFASPALQGGLYAAPDPAGFRSFSGRYRAKFGADPVRTATLAYDAVALVAAAADRVSLRPAHRQPYGRRPPPGRHRRGSRPSGPRSRSLRWRLCQHAAVRRGPGAAAGDCRDPVPALFVAYASPRWQGCCRRAAPGAFSPAGAGCGPTVIRYRCDAGGLSGSGGAGVDRPAHQGHGTWHVGIFGRFHRDCFRRTCYRA